MEKDRTDHRNVGARDLIGRQPERFVEARGIEPLHCTESRDEGANDQHDATGSLSFPVGQLERPCHVEEEDSLHEQEQAWYPDGRRNATPEA